MSHTFALLVPVKTLSLAKSRLELGHDRPACSAHARLRARRDRGGRPHRVRGPGATSSPTSPGFEVDGAIRLPDEGDGDLNRALAPRLRCGSGCSSPTVGRGRDVRRPARASTPTTSTDRARFRAHAAVVRGGRGRHRHDAARGRHRASTSIRTSGPDPRVGTSESGAVPVRARGRRPCAATSTPTTDLAVGARPRRRAPAPRAACLTRVGDRAGLRRTRERRRPCGHRRSRLRGSGLLGCCSSWPARSLLGRGLLGREPSSVRPSWREPS